MITNNPIPAELALIASPDKAAVVVSSIEPRREQNVETSNMPARERSEAVGGAYSATREGRRLNMLGFNSHLLDRDGTVNRNMG